MHSKRERVLAGFARTQLGIAPRAQLRDAGLSRNQVEYLVTNRRLERLFRSVYRVAGVPASYRQRLLGACWAGGDRGAMASHRAAALLWDLPGGAEVLEITSPRWRRTRHEDITVHETHRFDTIDVTVFDGLIPVTRPARTILDLCGLAERGLLAETVVEAALQEAIRRDLIDIALIGSRYERLGGDVRLGGKVAARLIHRWLPSIARTDSRPETILLDLLVVAGVPEPIPQFRVWLAPGEYVTLDFAWPEAKIGLEFDSYRWHGGRIKHDADARRELRLGERDWYLIRVTDAELDAGCPHAIPNLRRQLGVAA
jgi:hypothetical protein